MKGGEKASLSFFISAVYNLPSKKPTEIEKCQNLKMFQW